MATIKYIITVGLIITSYIITIISLFIFISLYSILPFNNYLGISKETNLNYILLLLWAILLFNIYLIKFNTSLLKQK